MHAKAEVTPPDLDADELARAAADLEAVTARLDETVAEVERLETILDAVLDDPGLFVCVVGEDGRITAVSRGLADRWSDAHPAIGRRVDDVAPKAWGDVQALVASVTGDQWQPRPVEGGVLSVRRATLPDREGGARDDGGAGSVVVLRFVEGGVGGTRGTGGAGGEE